MDVTPADRLANAFPCRLAEDTEGEQEANTRENAAEVLAAVARSRASPLTAQLAAPDFLEQLLRHAFGAQQGSTLVQVPLMPLPSAGRNTSAFTRFVFGAVSSMIGQESHH